MPSLKDLVNRRKAVQSTKKITLAMKMIAAAKLRKAQDKVSATRPYSQHMERMVQELAARSHTFERPPQLLLGNGQTERHRLLIITANRGLCGNFNTAVIRRAIAIVQELRKENKASPQLVCVGQKGRDILRASPYEPLLEGYISSSDKPSYRQAQEIARQLQEAFEGGAFDTCSIIFNHFISAMRQEVTIHQLIPYAPLKEPASNRTGMASPEALPYFEFEPHEEAVLGQLLPQNLAVQIYQVLLESSASEHGARMTAMDGASRNADTMIRALQMRYNRMRQHYITKELIEIISGAEAM